MISDDVFKKEEESFLSAIDEILYDADAVHDFVSKNYNAFYKMIPDGDYKQHILLRVYKNYLGRDRNAGNTMVSITDKEIRFLQTLPTDQLKRVFYSLLIRAKVKPHASGWISLRFEETIKYGFEKRVWKDLKLKILVDLKQYGVKTQVSGSTKPILCFRLPDIEEGNVVFEFLDGDALMMFKEISQYDTDR